MDNCAGASGLAVDRHRRPAGSADRGRDREPVDAALAVAPATCHTGSHDRPFRPPTATSLAGPIRLNTIIDAHPAKNPYGDPPLLILFAPPFTLIVTATDASAAPRPSTSSWSPNTPRPSTSWTCAATANWNWPPMNRSGPGATTTS